MTVISHLTSATMARLALAATQTDLLALRLWRKVIENEATTTPAEVPEYLIYAWLRLREDDPAMYAEAWAKVDQADADEINRRTVELLDTPDGVRSQKELHSPSELTAFASLAAELSA